MDLRTYIDQDPKRAFAVAAAVGVHWTTVYRWARGENTPSIKTAARIEAATAGAVTARDFLPGEAA